MNERYIFQNETTRSNPYLTIFLMLIFLMNLLNKPSPSASD